MFILELNLKNRVIPYLENEDYVSKRVRLLWENKTGSLQQAIQTDRFGEFVDWFMDYRTISLLPLVACSVVLERMIEAYDYCIRVQTAYFHGINQPKRDYHYEGIKRLIEEGCHKEAIHPILEWMALADYRITEDTGHTGWWTSYKDELYDRLGLSREGMNTKKEIMADTHNRLAIIFSRY